MLRGKGEKIIDKVDDYLTKFLMITSAALLLVIVSVMFVEVIFRYVFLHSLTWSGELTRYCAVWLALLAGGLGVRKGTHISIRALTKHFPKGLEKAILLFGYFTIVLFSAIMIWQGVKLMEITADQLSPSMHIPMATAYAAVPAGGLVMLIYGVILSLQAIGRSRPA